MAMFARANAAGYIARIDKSELRELLVSTQPAGTN
jgi:hypothetical protein